VYKVLVGKPEEKRPVRRQRRRWKDQNGSWGDGQGGVWRGSAWLRDQWWALVNLVMNIRVLAPRS
jgi:hypothetical protein